MPEPEDQEAHPRPLVPGDAIAESAPTEDEVPAPAPTADNDVQPPARSDGDSSGVPAGDAADVAHAEGAAPADDAGPAEDAIPAEEMPQGLRWSWDLDFDALMAALSEPAPWNRPVRPAPPQQASSPGTDAGPASDCTDPVADRDADSPAEPSPAASSPDSGPADAPPSAVDPVEAEFAEMLEAIAASGSQPLPMTVVAGRVAESLPTGPDLAGWLATGEVAGLEYGALAGMAASYRRLASWAQAGELAVVAQLAARAAAADARVGLDADGRPARLTDDACAQVSLALTMSQAAASWWSDLAVTLTWRLQATGSALRAGEIDLGRARLIADVTAVLDEDTARAVEARVLPAAGDQTIGQLRAALRRAVINADPEGAERRREDAERRAKVSLYPDPDGTASLAGSSLPGIRAAAAMARITALAKAMKAAGAGGGIDLLRAQVFLGLLLGTLPYIPPAPGAAPDTPPPHHPEDPSADGRASDANDANHGDPTAPSDIEPGEPSARQPGEHPADQPEGRATGRRRGGPSADVPPAASRRGRRRDVDRPDPSSRAPGPAPPGPSCGPAPPGSNSGPAPPQRKPRAAPPDPNPGPAPAGPAPPKPNGAPDPPADEPEPPISDPLPPCDPPDDEDLPRDRSDQGGWEGSDDDDKEAGTDSQASAWPPIPPALPPGPPTLMGLRPAQGGLLDLTVPWSTLVGESGEPGHLTRLGPITPGQARHLAELAATDPDIPWKAIVTSPDGAAIGVARVPRLSVSSNQRGPAARASVLRQVTVTICPDQETLVPDSGLPMIYRRTLRAAARAAEDARLQSLADAAAGGCAHIQASAAYQPPPLLREFITARDGTCRFPTCRQPVWHCDLDHCVPYHKGGRTCRCNLGGLCRFHHLLKQHQLWQLIQPTPGTFAWITPTGRTYYIEPDTHAA
jgi:Domain of unknown function (DUF222)